MNSCKQIKIEIKIEENPEKSKYNGNKVNQSNGSLMKTMTQDGIKIFNINATCPHRKAKRHCQ